MQTKVSVIVPVYNTEKYLFKCLKSIDSQSLRDIEIIIINDGSKDNSKEVIDNFKFNTDIIKVINKENEGLSATRNLGISVASGEYIAFIDSDDYIEEKMLEAMYYKAISDDLDIVVCNYNLVYDNNDKITKRSILLDNDKILTNIDAIGELFICNTIESFACNKLFRKDLLHKNNIEFPKNMKYEDMPTIVKLIYNSKRIGFINEFFYNYLQRDTSITGTLTIGHLSDYIKSIKIVKEYIINLNDKTIYNQFIFWYCERLNNAKKLFRRLGNKQNDKKLNELQKNLKHDFMKIFRDMITNAYITPKLKFKTIYNTFF